MSTLNEKDKALLRMADYFWNEKVDIERYSGFSREDMQRAFPEILKAWDDYKAARQALTVAISDAVDQHRGVL